MTLADHIINIQEGVRGGRFINEASVSQGIVLRLLQALQWPTFDTQIVCPEYTLQGRRVDYALCHPSTKPIVFIEVKQVGQSEGAERQLFEYVFHIGIQMAILTDGQEWHFFLPAERGLYQERRVYKLDILERDVEESVKRFERYLSYDNVCSGDAIDSARQDYRNVSKERQLRSTLPIAWRKLIEEQDDLLIELIADKVESLCGYKPDPDMVAAFLVSHHNLSPDARIAVEQTYQPNPPGTNSPSRRHEPSQREAPATEAESPGFILDGSEYRARNAKDVMVQVIEALSKRDSTFIQRFAALPRHGRTRRYVAATKEELYPGRPDLSEEYSYRLSSGYWIGTNNNKPTIKNIIKMACEVAGINYGDELKVNL